ncbi:MAG: dienelactone hydrolase family protein [Bacilli bacterium]
MKNSNRKLVLLIHEIYGVNDHMKHIQQLVEEMGYEVKCPNFLGENVLLRMIKKNLRIKVS